MANPSSKSTVTNQQTDRQESVATELDGRQMKRPLALAVLIFFLTWQSLSCGSNSGGQVDPRCGFWNTSYGVIGRVVGLSTSEFKQRCVRIGASPILYADAMPIGLKNGVIEKDRYRSSIHPDAVQRHVARVFALERLIHRVELVLLSGLYRPTFDVATAAIEQECRQRGVAFCHSPFFFGTNSRKILAALSPEDRNRITSLIRHSIGADAPAALPRQA